MELFKDNFKTHDVKKWKNNDSSTKLAMNWESGVNSINVKESEGKGREEKGKEGEGREGQ